MIVDSPDQLRSINRRVDLIGQAVKIAENQHLKQEKVEVRIKMMGNRTLEASTVAPNHMDEAERHPEYNPLTFQPLDRSVLAVDSGVTSTKTLKSSKNLTGKREIFKLLQKEDQKSTGLHILSQRQPKVNRPKPW